MTKSTLNDLNQHLFSIMEKLDDDDLEGEALEQELKRADAMTKISGQIIQNGQLQLNLIKHMDEYGYQQKDMPELFRTNQAVIGVKA